VGQLQDRVVIVTGAGRGIGRAYAEYLSGQGARLVVNDTGASIEGEGSSQAVAQTVADGIVAAGGTALADTHDVVTDAEALIAHALDEFGRIDGLVNNAGIVIMGGIDTVTTEQIDRMIDVHVRGSLNTVRAVWPTMSRQRYGRIVNVSSASVFGVGAAVSYPTVKAAILGLTRTLAVDGAPLGIKVNALMPMGYSRMADTQAGLGEFMKEVMPPERIGPFLGALLIEATPCTGETFSVGGGRAGRVFLGTAPGLTGFTTVDDVISGFDRVMDVTGYLAPSSMEAEIGFELQQLGFELSQMAIDLDTLGTAEVGG
jgi:NAD(P)-dependent dehydrogenase (short-subunit alcohol dehydrogenase family)